MRVFCLPCGANYLIMKPHIAGKLFFVILGVSFLASLRAQPLQVSATATPSICFNDGSITAYATGGSLPYSFILTSGPTIAGMAYPFYPTDLVSQFLSIPAGAYTLMVYDNAGDSSQTTVIVSGNYQFPTASYTITGGFTITINAAGGRPPYQYAISPVASNGPFSPKQNSNVFDTLCNGTYYVRVFDSCLNIYTTLGIIINRPPPDITRIVCKGSTLITHSDSTVFNYSTGTPPYRFDVYSGGSTISNSTGVFTIPQLCPDSIVVTDGCNVTDYQKADCTPIQSIKVKCFDCITHYLHVEATGGQAPYTYYYYGSSYSGPVISSNQTGIFTNLVNANVHYVSVTDACGRVTGRYQFVCLDPGFSTTCPFNNDVEVLLWGIEEPPVTITCNTCMPPVTITTRSFSTLFQNVGRGQHTFTITDSCGTSLLRTVFVDSGTIYVAEQWRSCNDLSLTAFNSFGVDITSSTYFELYDISTGTVYEGNYDGLFDNIPNGWYGVNSTYSTCQSQFNLFQFPHMPSFCLFPTYDNACIPSYDLRLADSWWAFTDDLSEKHSFVSVPPGVIRNEIPAGAGNGIDFNDVPVGNYNLVSDSGCSVPYNLSPHPTVLFTAYDSVDCLDNQYIVARVNPAFLRRNCFEDTIKFTYRVFRNNVLLGINTSGYFMVPDTGDYVVAVYYRVNNPSYYPQVPFNFNDSCFVDSIHIRARPRTLPFVHALDKQLCEIDAITNVPYSITGGVPPYTLHVPGRGTYAVNGSSGMLTGLGVDNYTLIVYDNCGISNSLTVSVVDTCFECGTLSHFLPEDTNACVGITVSYTDTSEHVQAYAWYVNGVWVSNQSTLNFRFDTVGFYTIMSIAANISCIDTTIRTVHATTINTFSLGSDLAICSYDTATLSAGINVVWSTGFTGLQIKTNQPGLYWAGLSNQCGTFYDTVILTARNSFPPSLGPDVFVCINDSIVLNPGNSYSSYLWQDASTDSVYVTSLPGLYWVEVVSDSCVFRDSIFISPGVLPPFFELGSDSVFCDTIIALIQTPYSNTVWSNGQIGLQIVANAPGVYWAEVQNACGIYRDSLIINLVNEVADPLGPDTFICDGTPYLLYAPVFVDSVVWWNGSTLPEDTITASGIYSVSYFKSGCVWNDTVEIDNVLTPFLSLGNDTLYCHLFSRVFQTPYSNTVWSTTETGNEIKVYSEGVYWARVDNLCGTYTDTIILRRIIVSPNALGSDTFTCNDNSLLLLAPSNADSVLWFDGTRTWQKEISGAGDYWVKYYEETCFETDTIRVETFLTPVLQIKRNVNECGNELRIAPGLEGVNYLWGDGSVDSVFTVVQSGIYKVTVSNSCGSDSSDVNVFLMGNDCRLVLPNAFTPNADGKNDVFKIITLCDITSFSLRVYNRWGELVFESRNPDYGWDGEFKNTPQPADTYIVYLSYYDECEKKQNQIQSTVALLY